MRVEIPTKGFVEDVGVLTEGNADFRHVLYTAKNMQLVFAMGLPISAVRQVRRLALLVSKKQEHTRTLATISRTAATFACIHFASSDTRNSRNSTAEGWRLLRLASAACAT